jgi:hypothetical protein
MRFETYIKDKEKELDIISLIELYQFIEYGNNLNEAFNFSSILNKLGFEVKKEKGLLHTMKNVSKGTKDLIWYTFKLYQGNEEYRQKIIDLYKSIDKEEVIDVLLRLDMLTFHTITGPIHMLDAITGWHLVPNLKRKVIDIKDRVQRVIDHLSNIRKEYTDDKVKKEVDKILNNFKGLFPI